MSSEKERWHDQLKPFQSLVNELADPANRPLVPPLDPTYQQQLRAHLLQKRAAPLSGRAVRRLWQFAATAVLLILLTVGLFNLWLTLSRQPAAAVPAARPTTTPTAAAPAGVPPLQWETAVSFPLALGDGLQIEHIDLRHQQFAPGQTIVFTLTWGTTAPPTADYDSFIHLYHPNGGLVAHHTSPLGPTADWGANAHADIDYTLRLPTPLPDPPYQLVVGLYDDATGERLVEVSKDGTLLLANIQLAQIQARIDGTSGNGVVVRQEPAGELLTVLPEGESLLVDNVQPVAADGLNWRQVWLANGNSGWVPTDFIAAGTKPAATPDPAIAACLGTLPAANQFEPPQPFPEALASSLFWVGSADLWTAVPPDHIWRQLPRQNGRYSQKLAWWSQHFDIDNEPVPALTVTGQRLNGPPASFSAPHVTSGFSEESGTFMLTGVEIPAPGCWEISGSYRGYTVSYLVWVDGN